MDTLVDDVGSFPLPLSVNRQLFDEAYVRARRAIIDGKDLRNDEFLFRNFYDVVLDSFRKKIDAGLDVINYPQHYDIHGQFMETIEEAMNKGTYVVDDRDATIPEVYVINEEAKGISEEIGKKIALRACVTGPMELYLKKVGPTAYEEILMMFAETVRRFAKNSILNSKCVKTEVVSLDEPSFGFQEISADDALMTEVLEKAFDFGGAIKQIHLHSLSRVPLVMGVRNVDVISFECAASPRNIESLSTKMSDKADKQLRVGISRTDIDAIMAELRDRGIINPNLEQAVESEETIRKRFLAAREKFGDRMTFTGPDCGLGGWPTPEAAQLLLKRTTSAVKKAKINHL
jgi:5-methyltetrahydropteroyltriglutamate--homocysteine methyltransferase